MTDLSELVVNTPDGEPLRIGEALEGPTVFALVRYFG